MVLLMADVPKIVAWRWEGVVSFMSIRCMQCNTNIHTHISVDSETFTLLPDIEAGMSCPNCGARGLWVKSRVRLAEMDESRQVPAPTAIAPCSCRFPA